MKESWYTLNKQKSKGPNMVDDTFFKDCRSMMIFLYRVGNVGSHIDTPFVTKGSKIYTKICNDGQTIRVSKCYT